MSGLGELGTCCEFARNYRKIGTCGGTVMTVPYIMGGKMVVALQEKI